MMVESWFSVPIWSFNLSIEDCYYDEAFKFCYSLSQNTKGLERSNVGGWHSELFGENNISCNYKPILPFIKFFKSKLSDCIKDLDSTSAILNLTDIWINVNTKDHYNKLHSHPNSIISGVFYLSKNNSKINFYKNRDFMSFTLESVNSNLNGKLSCDVVSYYPQRGDLLLFPSWLNHNVEINEIELPRISISFNTLVYFNF